MPAKKVVVVGAGAAGIMAACRAAELGASVTLLEKTDRIGTKILMSGGGKCNITHDGPLESVLKAFRKNEAVFLRPSFYRFTNRQVIELLHERGLQTYTRPNGRVFPIDRTAKDVVGVLDTLLRESRVKLRLETPVNGLVVIGGEAKGVMTAEGKVLADETILTVGGASFPKSGTTGDGYPWVKAAGHSIVRLMAALSPIDLDVPRQDWAGIALRDIVLLARSGGKVVAKWRDDLLFSHHGVTGPTALGISREVAESLLTGTVELQVDLAPDESFEALTEQMRAWKAQHPNDRASLAAEGFLPKALVLPFLQQASIPPTTKAQELSTKDLNRLVQQLKAWPLGTVKRAVFERGEVVAGGVSLDEVDPHNMRSLKCKNLLLAGEILDVAGPVGGYNLQAAWSTGYVAGETAAS